uniref:Uncharacterized protein n=1 Tax=Leersia perrieri TaxID=77586 RepID=A0A0D9XIP0_9ORYZ
MAASSSSHSPADHQHDDAGPTWQRHEEAKHRSTQSHHRQNLNVQVPVVPSTGCFAGLFRPSPTSSSASRSSSPSAAGGSHIDGRPASPSLIRSPSAWIRARGHSFASSARHSRRRSSDFHYDAQSYARNFDEGADGGEAIGDEAAAGEYRCFSSRLPASPPPVLSPAFNGATGDKVCEPGRDKGRDFN